MKRIIMFLGVCMSINGNMYAQLITTIAGPNTDINDALVMDSVGNIYGSEFGNSPLVSSSVYKIDTTGTVTKFSTGYGSCNGLAFDHQWNLYVVDFTSSVNSHQIYKLDSLGNKTPYGPTISGASGILFDPNSDTLYVSQYNGASANRISKLSPDGNVTLHTDHALLNGPVGMAFDSTNTLYVANFTDGEIYQVTHNGDSLRLMANIPNVSFWGVGFLTYAGGYLFATGIGVHKIFKISLTGEVSEFAGTGVPGSDDGTADVAQFNRPNGITPNYQGDKLYVSDYGTESIREIISSQLTGIESLDHASNSPIRTIRSYPNPASEWMNVVYVLHRNSHVRLQFFSVEGRLYWDKVSTFQEQGTHQYKIDTSLLTPGIYYLRLTSDGYSTTVKVSVMH